MNSYCIIEEELIVIEDEEERSRIHAGNYIFKTNVGELVTEIAKKSFAGQNLGSACAPCAPP